jgi:hypothetical protein
MLFLALLAFLPVVASPAAQVNKATALARTKPAALDNKPSPGGPALHILSDTVLGEEPLRNAVDVRWASDHSVVLALKKSGVVEYNLNGKSVPQQMIAGEKSPGGFWESRHVAISSRYLVAGSWLFAMTWRPLDSIVRKEEAVEFIHDLDVRNNRVAVVGARRDAQGQFSPDGAIAWIGSLDKALSDLKPLIFDAGGSGAPSMNACGSFSLGSTRFLADGSLLVVPGVQPGIYHFDSQGKLLGTSDTVALGIDTDCGGMSKELAATLGRDVPRRLAWINDRRTVDDVLPLPAGPGLLVRSVQQGQVRWTLKVLHPDGSLGVYDVPVQAPNPFSHLKGDFRQGRLVLLLFGYPPDRNPEHTPLPHLLIASPPGS